MDSTTEMEASGAPKGIVLGIARVRELLEMVKFEHTVFALPFAFIGALAATEGRIPWRSYFWILVAMVGARTLAMAYNRVADADLDAENPRTSGRALPAGRVKQWMAWLMVGLSACVFGLAAAMLGPLTTKLAPYAFVVLLGYSFTKRFTAWSHAVLGLGLACAPAGAWMAVSGRVETPAFWLSLGVLAWTAGFDIIYALQDRDFDIKRGLHSMPVELGVGPALMLSAAFHALAVVSWALFLFGMGATLFPWLALAAVTGILFREQWVVRRGGPDRMDHAFFTLNSVVGLIMLAGFFAHWVLQRAFV